MRVRPLAITIVVAAAAAYAASAGCGSSSSSTNPAPQPVAESFNSGNLAPNVPFSHTFAAAGSYGYRCIYHASVGMTGTVTVSGSSSVMLDSVLVGQGGNNFVPSTITIAPNGTVKWKLVTGTHTVTRP